jgi:uncharacterized membrane protein
MDVGERLVPATVFLVLGGGFVALALGFGWFWWVWVIGYAVVLPLVAVLTGPEGPPVPPTPGDRGQSDREDEESTQDALDALRERYARGELTEAQFERKLDRLLETETVEGAADAARNRTAERERERE